MPLATKNGSLIVKDGKLAEDCGCCGGWYCYGNECANNVNPALIPWTCGTGTNDIPPDQIVLSVEYSGLSVSSYVFASAGASTYRKRTIEASQSLSTNITLTRSTFSITENDWSNYNACCYRGVFQGRPITVLPGVRPKVLSGTPSPWQAGLGFTELQQFTLQINAVVTFGEPEPEANLPQCCMTSGDCAMPDTSPASGSSQTAAVNVIPDNGRGATFADFAFASNGPYSQSIANLRGIRWSFSMEYGALCLVPAGVGERPTNLKSCATFTVVG
jgi:hypothetical protein